MNSLWTNERDRMTKYSILKEYARKIEEDEEDRQRGSSGTVIGEKIIETNHHEFNSPDKGNIPFISLHNHYY